MQFTIPTIISHVQWANMKGEGHPCNFIPGGQVNLAGVAAAIQGLVPLLQGNPQMLQLLRNAHQTQAQQGAGAGLAGLAGAGVGGVTCPIMGP